MLFYLLDSTHLIYVLGGARGRSSLILLFHCMNGDDRTGHINTIDTPTIFVGGVCIHLHLSYVLGVRGARGRSSPVLLFHCRNGADRTGRVEWCTS
jgi:hypothetical protein